MTYYPLAFFKIASAAEITTLAFAQDPKRPDQKFLLTGGSEPMQVLLGSSHQMMAFPPNKLRQDLLLVSEDVEIELDLASAEAWGIEQSVGALVLGPGYRALVCKADGKTFSDARLVPIGEAKAYVDFDNQHNLYLTKWRIVKHSGSQTFTLFDFEASQKVRR